jgi:hypothetical protein
MTHSRPARLAAALFLVTAVLFVVGVSTEPDSHDETTEEHADTSGTNGEAAEGETQDEAEEQGEEAHSEAEAEGGEAHDETGEDETVLGIDVESPAAIALAVIVSAALAAALLFRLSRPVALAAILFGVAFAVLDIAEVAHQLDESRTGYALLSIVIAVGHAAAALAARQTLTQRNPA